MLLCMVGIGICDFFEVGIEWVLFFGAVCAGVISLVDCCDDVLLFV